MHLAVGKSLPESVQGTTMTKDWTKARLVSMLASLNLT